MGMWKIWLLSWWAIKIFYMQVIYTLVVLLGIKDQEPKEDPNVVPYHSAISLNETIMKFNIPRGPLLGSHDKEAVSYQDLIDYITD